jgi:hypothetical protein
MRQWYIVYPKGKELSLVARTFLDFVVKNEPKIREQMQTMWPALKQLLKEQDNTTAATAKKKTATRKKKTSKK